VNDRWREQEPVAPSAGRAAVFRTAFDQGAKPMRVTVTVWPAGRNQFIVNVDALLDPQYDLASS